ncbi:hypothetical protein KSF78_0001832 [Schistosoma japonicum]|nr:hypothetical protein KSF78_0001832 [Schistosoma japonicum]
MNRSVLKKLMYITNIHCCRPSFQIILEINVYGLMRLRDSSLTFQVCFSRHDLSAHNAATHKQDPRPYRFK